MLISFMCVNCWRDRGSPTIDNERTRRAVELIGDVYECHGAGGGLHVILDDFNIDNGHMAFCAGYIDSDEYKRDCSPGRLAAERACLVLLRGMTVDERASALARYHYPEYFKIESESEPGFAV